MAEFLVTTEDDTVDASDGVLSLREAIIAANDLSAGNDDLDPHRITFDADVFVDGGTIRLGEAGALSVDADIIIDGDVDDDGTADIVMTGDTAGDDLVLSDSLGNEITDVTGDTRDDNVQVFLGTGASHLTLENIVVTGGAASRGGAIETAGDLTLTNTSLSGNFASNSGGAATVLQSGALIATGASFENNQSGGDAGALRTTGNVTIEDSTFTRNEAENAGGAIYGTVRANEVFGVSTSTFADNTSGAKGGGVNAQAFDGGAIAISGTEFLGNAAASIGGGLAGLLEGSSATVTGSTFGGNTGTTGSALDLALIVDFLGADPDDGELLYGPDSSATINNSTFVGNIATGTDISGGPVTASTIALTADFGTPTQSAELNSSTFTGNTSTSATAANQVVQSESIGSIEIEINSTIILGNDNDSVAEEFNGVLGVLNTGAVDDVFADVAAGAGVLTDNGGQVQTVALLADAANPALDTASVNRDFDARGFNGSLQLDPANDFSTDFGAFELQASEIVDGPLVVNTTSDSLELNFFDDELTLREAVAMAADGGTITFDADVFSDANFASDTSTINLQETLTVTGNVIIDGDTDGDGDADVVVSGDADGDDNNFVTAGSNDARINLVGENDNDSDNVQVLSIGPGEVALNGLVITGGNNAMGVGGILSLYATDLTIENSVIGGNSGQIGGLDAVSNVTLRNTDIVNNIGTIAGGARFAMDPAPEASDVAVVIDGSYISGNTGGIYATVDALTVTNTTIDGNRDGNFGGLAAFGGAVTISDSLISNNATEGNGGGIVSNGALTITNSEIIDNEAGLNGGGVAVNAGGSLALTASLVAGNRAEENGGGLSLSGDDNTLINVTIANNTGIGTGGGVYVAGRIIAQHITMTGNRVGAATAEGADRITGVADDGSGGSTFTNSLIVGNGISGAYSLNIGGELNGLIGILAGANNIFGEVDPADIFADVAAIDGVRGGLIADNGGPVRTVALLVDADNPAIDGASGLPSVRTDARGRDRSDFPGLRPGFADIGAFELINQAPVVTTTSFSISEGQTALGTVPVTDDIDTGVTFSIGGGADLALFTIDPISGALAFVDAPNFEAPQDADQDNVYELIILPSDGREAVFQPIEVTVTDVAEAQTIVTDPDGGPTTGSDEGDTVAGGTGDDVVDAGLGDDIIVDAGGDDTVNAGGGDDKVGLLSGMNTVSGGDGADLIVGGFGNDDLAGDAGMDVIVGDVSTNLFGSDRITGGTGNDLLEGRGGVDTFVFATGDGDDTIGAIDIDFATPANSTVTGADFVSGVDVIELSGFGLADSDAALAAVTDVSGVATFDAEGTTITFAGLTADDLSADDFILV